MMVCVLDMVDNYLIENFQDKSLLSEFIESEIETKNFLVTKQIKKNFWSLINKNEPYYKILSIDTVDMVINFANKLMNIDFNSILITGLGLGIIPFICQNKTEIVDVLEVDLEIIELVKKIGHLKENVKIYNEDIKKFSTDKKYDVILFDHWMSFAPQSEMFDLEKKFSDNLNNNGIFTFPIYEQTLR